MHKNGGCSRHAHSIALPMKLNNCSRNHDKSAETDRALFKSGIKKNGYPSPLIPH